MTMSERHCVCSPSDGYLELFMNLQLDKRFFENFCCLYCLFLRLKFWIITCWPFTGSTFWVNVFLT